MKEDRREQLRKDLEELQQMLEQHPGDLDVFESILALEHILEQDPPEEDFA